MFRWLLSNLLLILVIVSVIYSYMFWGNLTGKDTPVGKAVAYLSNEFDDVGQFVEGVKNKQARLAGTSSNQQLDKQAVAEIDTAISDVESDVDMVDTSVTTQEDQGVEKQAATQADTSEQKLPQDNVQESTSVDGVVQAEQLALEQEKLEQEKPEQVDSKLVVAEQTTEDLSQIKSQQTDEGKSQLVDQKDEQQLVEQQPVSISYSHNKMRVQQNSDGELEVQPQSLITQVENAVTQKTESMKEEGELSTTNDSDPKRSRSKESISKNDFVSTEIASQLESIDESGNLEKEVSAEQGSKTALETMSIPEVWVTARKSFYQKKYDLSEKSYQSVIARTKDNFDAYGELGNVYFNQGKDAQAAEAYLQAATILLVKGDIQRAQNLLQVLQQLDAAKAKQLQRLIGQPLS